MTLDKNKDDLNIPTQTIEQAMSDENAIYYKFENGKIAKYSKEEGLYYTLNKKNEWKVDERVLPWIIGSDYDYDVIKPHKKVGR